MLNHIEWMPASVMNWYLYPIAASSFWNFAIVLSSRFAFQLNDGEQLYASIFVGCSRRIASENFFASLRSGTAVSHHRRSAYGAYASPREIAWSRPARVL